MTESQNRVRQKGHSVSVPLMFFADTSSQRLTYGDTAELLKLDLRARLLRRHIEMSEFENVVATERRIQQYKDGTLFLFCSL